MKLLSALLWFFLAISSAMSYAAPVTRSIYNDALGSPVAATDHQGNVLWKEDYRPFGERIIKDSNSDDQKRWFTGHVQDKDTGLVYMGARFYDPSIGRFVSPDPVGFSPNAPMMFNRYAYANNNRYKYVDPDGRAPHRWADGNYSDNDGQANPGWSAQINRAQGQIGYGLSEGWQYSPAIMVGAGEGVVLFGLLKNGFKPAIKGAAQIAREGGRHSGQFKQFLKQTPDQLQKTIKSFDKQVAKHEGWIKDPASKVKNFDSLRKEHQENLIHHWGQDIGRAKELKSIAKDVLKGV